MHWGPNCFSAWMSSIMSGVD
uniref:Uncharacterized protein n=1 Tax=Arundo donax TaxID=35708 RepID=A0A0A9GLC9_ARUDO